MTVGELMKVLSSYPVDMPVVRVNSDVDYGTGYFPLDASGVAAEELHENLIRGHFYSEIHEAPMGVRKCLGGPRKVLTMGGFHGL